MNFNVLIGFLLINTVLSLGKTALIDLPIVVRDNHGSSQELRVGIDPSATDGIDTHLGEAVLPPLPPTGIFDSRFNLADYESSLKDYRFGVIGSQVVTEHLLQFKPGNGNIIIIEWNFPIGISGRLQDIITGTLIDISMQNSGSYSIDNPLGYNKVKITMNYSIVNSQLETDPDSQLSLVLHQNFPNPFNPKTTIIFDVGSREFVTLSIFNLLAVEVVTLRNEILEKGRYSVIFDAERLPSGVYISELRTPSRRLLRKLVVLK